MKDASPKDEKETPAVTAQLRAESIAYAVQTGVFNLAANFVEPYINYRIQQQHSIHNEPQHTGNNQPQHVGGNQPQHAGGNAVHVDGAHPEARGTYTQNLVGEFAGDLIGSSTLILAETLIPGPLHAFTRAARSLVDPVYTPIAHMVLAKDRFEPDHEERVEQWKTFQERNLVRSAIMATAGIAGNVLTQKYLVGNPSPTSLILKGKLLSTALTTATELGVRFAFPHHMGRLDKWMGGKFAPMMKDETLPGEENASTLHTDKIEQERCKQKDVSERERT